MIQVICDPRGNFEIIARAAELISLCARLNLTVADAKRNGSTRPREYFEQLGLAYHNVTLSVAQMWAENGRSADMAAVLRVIENGIASLSSSLGKCVEI